MDNAAVNEYGGNRHSHTLRLGVENGTFLEGNLAMLHVLEVCTFWPNAKNLS